MEKKQIAEKELAKRELARRLLIEFLKYNIPTYVVNWHHQEIADHLQAAESGELQKVMIFMPPRHGKSLLATTGFPAWYMGRNPDSELISISYNAELATTFGREVRNLVRLPSFQNIFQGISLSEDSRSVGKWNTNKGGQYIAVGVGGAITGRGARLMLIDDPVKNPEDVATVEQRDKMWNWYTTVAATRLYPDSRQAVIMTRWHDDDLAGRILNSTDGKNWKIVSYPAIATEDEHKRKKGEALWPEHFNLDFLHEQKNLLGTVDFSALYQQNPVPGEGIDFKASWFKHRDWDEVKNLNTRNFLTIDTAISEKSSGDYTGWVENYVDSEGNWNIIAKRYRISPGFLVNMLFESFQNHQWEKIGIEKTIYLQAIEGFLDEEMRKRGIYLPIVELEHRQTSKEVRIRGLAPRYERGGVNHIGETCKDLEEELLRFPKAVHDDLSDALAYQLQIAEQAFPEEYIQRQDIIYRRGDGFLTELL